MKNKILFFLIFFLSFCQQPLKAESTFFEKCSFIIDEKAIKSEEVNKLSQLFQLMYIKEGPFYIFYGLEKDTMLILADEIKARKLVKNEENLILSCVKKEIFSLTFLRDLVKTFSQYKDWEREEKNKKIISWIGKVKGVKVEKKDVEFLREEFLKDVKNITEKIKEKCVYFSQKFEDIKEEETLYEHLPHLTKEIYEICPLSEIKEFIENL